MIFHGFLFSLGGGGFHVLHVLIEILRRQLSCGCGACSGYRSVINKRLPPEITDP